MFKLFKKCFSLISKKQKTNTILILIGNQIGSILEVIGLGIIPILVKKSVLNNGNQKRRYVEILENQLISQRKSIDIWKKKLSRRDFIKGLALTATATKFAIKKV